jgi:hypothetical protein
MTERNAIRPSTAHLPPIARQRSGHPIQMQEAASLRRPYPKSLCHMPTAEIANKQSGTKDSKPTNS